MSGMFNSLGNGNNQQQPDPVQQIKSNPSEYLTSRGFNLPEGINTNDPTAIINSLIQSGQIGNPRMQWAMQVINRMRGGR